MDTPHWNAFVAPNGAIWVFTGLLRDIESDDELAAALGHELAHYTHEHGRRQVKRNYWIGLTAAVAGEMVSGMNPGRAQWAASAAHELAFNAWTHHYDRKDEDQAGRVGLRYAAEAGYDVTAAVRLWQHVLQTRGDQGAADDFFYGNHSLTVVRIAHLQEEIRNNSPQRRKRAQ